MSDAKQWAYSEKVKAHFMSPKNILAISEEEYNPDGKGMIGSPACGDMMMVLVKIAGNRIIDFKWKTFGCASAIASTSALSELVLENGGMTLDQAYKITPEEIITQLGGLPSNKIHCSVLGDKALRAAIDDYFKRNSLPNPYAVAPSPVVCTCMNITEENIRMEVLEGAQNLTTVMERTKLGSVCGKCKESAGSIIDKYVKQYYSDEIYTGTASK